MPCVVSGRQKGSFLVWHFDGKGTMTRASLPKEHVFAILKKGQQQNRRTFQKINGDECVQKVLEGCRASLLTWFP
jgi:hypothetical protein